MLVCSCDAPETRRRCGTCAAEVALPFAHSVALQICADTKLQGPSVFLGCCQCLSGSRAQVAGFPRPSVVVLRGGCAAPNVCLGCGQNLIIPTVRSVLNNIAVSELVPRAFLVTLGTGQHRTAVCC